MLACYGALVLDSLPLRRRKTDRPKRFKRGVYLLPSLLTVANLFCGLRLRGTRRAPTSIPLPC